MWIWGGPGRWDFAPLFPVTLGMEHARRGWRRGEVRPRVFGTHSNSVFGDTAGRWREDSVGSVIAGDRGRTMFPWGVLCNGLLGWRRAGFFLT